MILYSVKRMVSNVKNIVKYARLLDLYGDLLTRRQYDAMDLYYCLDLTLEEIAQNYDVSKQAVHYTIKNAELKIEKADERFHFAQKCEQIEERIGKIIEDIKNGEKSDIVIEKLSKVTNDLK